MGPRKPEPPVMRMFFVELMVVVWRVDVVVFRIRGCTNSVEGVDIGLEHR